MAKELYLYSGIYDFVAEGFISQMEENKADDIVIRANTPGGNVFAGWGMIAKIKEHELNVKMKVDGFVASMGTFLLAYVDDTEALDVSRIHLHRADGYVNSPEDQAFLNDINKDLKSKFSAKINSEKLKEIKGVSIEDIFNPEVRVEVWLTAKEAKQIGLIKKIVKLDPVEISAMNRLNIAASVESGNLKQTEYKTKVKNMTLEELKAQHPALYATIVAEGVEKERDRVGGWLAFNDIDPTEVSKGIKEGKGLSVTAMAEFTRKGMNAEALKKIESDAVPPVKTVEADIKTEKEKQIEAFEAELSKFK